jgi:two-component system KDP operon response regulator KdpE
MSRGSPVVLLVEDDTQTRRMVSVALNSWGYNVLEASTAELGLELTAWHRPDAIVLDLGCDDADEGTQRIRKLSQVPIIVTSAAWDDLRKVRALNEGANDYLAKPYVPAKLEERIRAALGGAPPLARDRPRVADLGDEVQIDLSTRRVLARGRAVRLTRVEFKLLGALLEHLGATVTYEGLLTAVWGPGHIQQLPSLRRPIMHLRRKLERDPAWPKYLLTETGIGYQLRAR